MSEIRRIYVEKKDAFAVEAKGLLADMKNFPRRCSWYCLNRQWIR